MIKGKAGVIVIDMQKGILDQSVQWYKKEDEEVIRRGRVLLDYCREIGIPIIYLQEVHRESMIDFGRELDGDEDVHCREDNPYTAVAEEALGRLPSEPLIVKRRYSGFLYTELEVVLSGLGLHPGDTLILFGGFADVCVHYTFVDAHQRDYRLRVVTDLLTASTKRAQESAIEAMRYLQHEAPCTMEQLMEELREYAQRNPKIEK
jgi:nicotinamidase-related amidase